MKTPLKLGVLTLAIAATLAPVIAAAPDRWGAYDFAYQSVGDARVKPVQVFDDGRTTYFQFRAGEAVPAIFAETQAGPVLLMPSAEGPYIKVPSTPRHFTLKMGRASSRVSYAAAPRAEAPALAPANATASGTAPGAVAPALINPVASRPHSTIGAYLPRSQQSEYLPPASPGAASATPTAQGPAPAPVPPAGLLAAAAPIQGLPADMFRQPPPRPTLERDSYSTPVRGDLVDWNQGAEKVTEISLAFPTNGAKVSAAALKAIRNAVQAAKASTRFEVIGLDDSGLKEKLAEGRAAAVASALVGAGAARAAVTTKSSSESRSAGNGLWVGAVLRVIDTGNGRPAPGTDQRESAAIDVAWVAQRLRAGELSPAEAISMLQKANQAAAVVPRTSAVPPVWHVRKADETVERLLGRWAREAGWRLVWLSGPTVPVVGESQFSRPDIVQAVDYVINQVRSAGHQIQATAYLGNRTLVVKGE